MQENLPCNQSCFYELDDTFVPKAAPLAATDGGCMDDDCAGRLCDLVYAAENQTTAEGIAARLNLTTVYGWNVAFLDGKRLSALVECEKRRACPRDNPDTSADERALDNRTECGCCLTSTNSTTSTTTKPLQRRIVRDTVENVNFNITENETYTAYETVNETVVVYAPCRPPLHFVPACVSFRRRYA